MRSNVCQSPRELASNEAVRQAQKTLENSPLSKEEKAAVEGAVNKIIPELYAAVDQVFDLEGPKAQLAALFLITRELKILTQSGEATMKVAQLVSHE